MGKKLGDIALPAIGTVYSAGGKWNRNEVFFGFQSFTVPPSVYRYDLKVGYHFALGQSRRACNRSLGV